MSSRSSATPQIRVPMMSLLQERQEVSPDAGGDEAPEADDRTAVWPRVAVGESTGRQRSTHER